MCRPSVLNDWYWIPTLCSVFQIVAIFKKPIFLWVWATTILYSFSLKISNIVYVNIFIFAKLCRMDPLLLPWTKPLQHVSTLVRQFLFDFIIVVEDCVLLGYALNSNITELQKNKTVFVITLLGFQLVGLILKCVYYR